MSISQCVDLVQIIRYIVQLDLLGNSPVFISTGKLSQSSNGEDISNQRGLMLSKKPRWKHSQLCGWPK